MFRTLLRIVSPNTPSPATPSSVPRPTLVDQISGQVAPGNHRARLMSMRLEHTRICGVKCCERLRKANIVTAGDLATCNPAQVARQLKISRKALRLLKRHRQAIRLSASIPGMMPPDAALLIGIHRGDVHSLSMESAGSLHCDLVRFSLSTEGARMIGRRRLPSARKIRSWISECKSQTLATGFAAA